jgi:hypothetical protein
MSHPATIDSTVELMPVQSDMTVLAGPTSVESALLSYRQPFPSCHSPIKTPLASENILEDVVVHISVNTVHQVV